MNFFFDQATPLSTGNNVALPPVSSGCGMNGLPAFVTGAYGLIANNNHHGEKNGTNNN